jgi:hypothetical protein
MKLSSLALRVMAALITAVYNRFAYLDERREALAAWGKFVEGLLS